MKSESLRVCDYVNRIHEGVERINCYTEDMIGVTLLNNALVQDAVIRNIENHSTGYRLANPGMLKQEIYRIHRQGIHGYISVNMEIFRKTLQRDLPELGTGINNLLGSLSDDREDLGNLED